MCVEHCIIIEHQFVAMHRTVLPSSNYRHVLAGAINTYSYIVMSASVDIIAGMSTTECTHEYLI